MRKSGSSGTQRGVPGKPRTGGSEKTQEPPCLRMGRKNQDPFPAFERKIKRYAAAVQGSPKGTKEGGSEKKLPKF